MVNANLSNIYEQCYLTSMQVVTSTWKSIVSMISDDLNFIARKNCHFFGGHDATVDL